MNTEKKAVEIEGGKHNSMGITRELADAAEADPNLVVKKIRKSEIAFCAKCETYPIRLADVQVKGLAPNGWGERMIPYTGNVCNDHAEMLDMDGAELDEVKIFDHPNCAMWHETSMANEPDDSKECDLFGDAVMKYKTLDLRWDADAEPIKVSMAREEMGLCGRDQGAWVPVSKDAIGNFLPFSWIEEVPMSVKLDRLRDELDADHWNAVVDNARQQAEKKAAARQEEMSRQHDEEKQGWATKLSDIENAHSEEKKGWATKLSDIENAHSREAIFQKLFADARVIEQYARTWEDIDEERKRNLLGISHRVEKKYYCDREHAIATSEFDAGLVYAQHHIHKEASMTLWTNDPDFLLSQMDELNRKWQKYLDGDDEGTDDLILDGTADSCNSDKMYIINKVRRLLRNRFNYRAGRDRGNDDGQMNELSVDDFHHWSASDEERMKVKIKIRKNKEAGRAVLRQKNLGQS